MPEKNPHVTSFGRAISPGRVTRASLHVRRPKARPLPLHLQVHPKALSPTSHNPQCYGFTLHKGLGMEIARRWDRDHLMRGSGLEAEGRFLIQCGELEIGWCNDISYAMAWKQAARHHGIWCEVYEEN